MEIVYGGIAEGKLLAHHQLIDSVHLTGAAATYDAVVWGANKAKVLIFLVIPALAAHGLQPNQAMACARWMDKVKLSRLYVTPTEMPLPSWVQACRRSVDMF